MAVGRLDAAGVRLADLAADGRELQRPRGSDRLDSIALPRGPTRHALFRRSPHADVHRLSQPRFSRVLAKDLAGLYHAGGPRRLSLYQIAQIVNRVGGYDPKLLMGCPRVEAGPIPPRAGNVTLDSTALNRELGGNPFDPWPLDDDHLPTHRDWHHERNSQPGSPELLARVLYRNPRLCV